jgi:geranylgeranyl pyrophosphate synthase
MDTIFDPKFINEKVQSEIDYFLKNETALKADIEYVYKIGIPDRPKAYLMLQFAQVLGIDAQRIMPFVIVADLMMAAAMNDDDIIDDNSERCGQLALWKIKGINSTITVTSYMYALIFSILKKYRVPANDKDFGPYQKSENLLLDYFRMMNIAQYKTTISADSLEKFNLVDLKELAIKKASLLFQFCTAVPAYFANKFVDASERFGYELGIARQYISDVQDFMEVLGDSYKQGTRMEDYFTHQPNLVLVLIGTSSTLSKEEKEWFYKNWINPVNTDDKLVVTERVRELINKTNAINEAKKILFGMKENLQKSLVVFPDEEFKRTMSKWAFRSFPME